MSELAECTLLDSRVPAVVVPLSQGQVAFVDPENVPLVVGYSWWARRYPSGLWYAHAYVRGSGRANHRVVSMHQLVSGGVRVDHKDRNGLNNTKVNLRFADKAQNGANRGPQSNNTSGFKGVFFNRGKGRWEAKICVRGKRTYLGRFGTAEEAARVYDHAAVRQFGEFACTNVMLGLLPAEGSGG